MLVKEERSNQFLKETRAHQDHSEALFCRRRRGNPNPTRIGIPVVLSLKHHRRLY